MAIFRVPVATYRIQFHPAFGFSDARALVPYLHGLGVTDLYSSPVLKARRGSSHGYDVTDPLSLNPELGGAGEFEALVGELRQRDMGLLLDIVPNHMAATPENPQWTDFLENGPSSAYAAFFQIVWHPAGARGPLEDKVLLPILEAPYGKVLENQELILGLDENGFFVRYHEARIPLDPKSYRALLAHRLDEIKGRLGPDYLSLVELTERLPERTETDPQRVQERRRATEVLKRRLWQLYNTLPEIHDFLAENMKIFNGRRGDPKSFDLLDQFLADQAYWLAFWRVVTEKINYRRFFDITDLIGIRAEDPRVFDATHALILRLAREGKLSGLRIDHIDGLYDPVEYLRRLQNSVASPGSDPAAPAQFYMVVEKILMEGEELPEEWPVCGTTGYDFLNAVNRVFVHPQGAQRLREIYSRFTGSWVRCKDVVYEQKKRVMEDLFTGELLALGHHLGLLAEQYRHARYLRPKELAQALVEVTACFPVYRTYIRSFEVPAPDRARIDAAVGEAQERNPDLTTPVFEFLRRVLLLEFPTSLREEQRQDWLLFVMRWQQFSGPVMAKGLEDTACYLYNSLISLNEVGSAHPGGEETAGDHILHSHNRGRLERSPYTLNATSTHDTKRSEDVRARINILSEIPDEWGRRLLRWSRWNRGRKPLVRDRPVPEANEEILLYQTLLGAWPLSEEEVADFKDRLRRYMVKAAREAKTHTSWIHPDPNHEQALCTFVESILEPAEENRFLPDFLDFWKSIAYWGALSSLSQLLLKIGSPGAPDFYQGSELWDLSLVDPDNRRPVDFQIRIKALEEIRGEETRGLLALADELLSRWEDGRLKLFLTYRALNFRKSRADLFRKGEYLPVAASGKRKEHVCAFARRSGEDWALVVVPRLFAGLAPAGKPPLGRRAWKDTVVLLPEGAPARWFNVLTGETPRASLFSGGEELRMERVFYSFPFALLSSALPPALGF